MIQQISTQVGDLLVGVKGDFERKLLDVKADLDKDLVEDELDDSRKGHHESVEVTALRQGATNLEVTPNRKNLA